MQSDKKARKNEDDSHYEEKPKKEVTLLALEVLKKHTNINNTLKLKQIKELIKKEYEEYGYNIEDKALRDSLNRLIDLGYRICWDKETEVREKDGEIRINRSGWYYEHEFSDAELQFLVDSVVFSKYIPKNVRKEIIGKLEDLSCKHFKHGRVLPLSDPRDEHLLFTALEVVNEAIDKRRKISFYINGYGEDKKLHPFIDKDKPVVSPYRIAIKNERYYLICAYGDENSEKKLYHLRLDRMSDIEILEGQRIRPLASVYGIGREIEIEDYLKKRIYMHSGDSDRVKFRADKKVNPNIVGHIIDWLGKDVEFRDSTDESVIVYVDMTKIDMLYWALQYGEAVEILEPKELRDDIRRAVEAIRKKY